MFSSPFLGFQCLVDRKRRAEKNPCPMNCKVREGGGKGFFSRPDLCTTDFPGFFCPLVFFKKEGKVVLGIFSMFVREKDRCSAVEGSMCYCCQEKKDAKLIKTQWGRKGEMSRRQKKEICGNYDGH